MDISLTMSPNSDKEVNLNLQCRVKRKGMFSFLISQRKLNNKTEL